MQNGDKNESLDALKFFYFIFLFYVSWAGEKEGRTAFLVHVTLH